MAWWQLGRKGRGSDPSPEIDKIFGKVLKFLNDEAAQNVTLPEEMRKAMASNGPCDRVTSGIGEFGRAVTNPIPVNGPLGEVIYLSRLMTSNGVPLAFNRLGSQRGVDVYELLSLDGKQWDLLYLSMYYPRKSRVLPTGYRVFADQSRGNLFRGTNAQLDGFPRGIYQATFDCAKQLIQLPFVDDALKVLEGINPTRRSKEHLAVVQEVLLEKSSPSSARTVTPERETGNDDRLAELVGGVFQYLKGELENAASEEGIELDERFEREFTYALLFVATSLIFRCAARTDPAKASDRLSIAILREVAEAEGQSLDEIVREYRARYEVYRNVELMQTEDDFLLREGSLILGQHLTGRTAAMIFGSRARTYLGAAVEPLRSGIVRLGY